MGGLIISIAIILIAIILFCRKFESAPEGIFMGLFMGGIFSMFVIAILLVGAEFRKETIRIYEEKQYEICGLENKTNTESYINGAFVLGFGYVNGSSSETIKYYYFKCNENGKKLESIDGTDIYIRETNEQTPCLIRKYREVKNKGFWKWVFGEGKSRQVEAEILVVPENTIKIEYNVDI